MDGEDQPEAFSVVTIGHSKHSIETFLGLLRQTARRMAELLKSFFWSAKLRALMQ